nr:DNA helicase [Tanacetum cinerariifolium]
MVRDSVQLETAVNTISHEYLLDFTSEYGIPETLHPELPGPEDRIVDFPEGKVDERVFPTVVDWRTNASKDGMPANGTYSVKDVRALDTHRTPIQKQPEMLLCVVGISRRYYLGGREIELFSLIRAPNPTKVKTGSRPRATHEVPLLTLIATRVIEMDEPAVGTDSSGVPSTIERSPLDFAHEAEASGRGTAAPEMPPPEDSRKRGHDGIDANAPPKSLRRDHADLRPSGSSRGGKSLAAMQFCLASNVFVSEGVPADVSDPDPLAFADAPSPHPVEVEANAKRATEDKSARLSRELERMHAQFLDLQVSNERLSQQVATLQQQVFGEEKLKAAFEEFKKRQSERVKQRCAEMDARLDALSVEFDEELYPHILTAIAGRKWVIGHGLRLAVMKCGESLEMRARAGQRNVESIEAYDPEAKAKFTAALQALKDLMYPLLDQLEGLKDAPIDVIMAALYLENDTREDEEIGLADAIAANISRAEQKKRSRIVCRTHGVGSAHHASTIWGTPPQSVTTDPRHVSGFTTRADMCMRGYYVSLKRVVFREKDQLESVANNPHNKKTTLTKCLDYNSHHADGRQLTYLDFPSKFVWDKSHRDIRTVNHIVYPTCRAACEVMGLLGDDKDWESTLIEASTTATPTELRTLLAHIFTHCKVSNPLTLWKRIWNLMSNDIPYVASILLGIPNLHIESSELENYTKYEFEACLNHCSRSLTDFGIPLPPEDLMLVLTNRLLMEEKSYDHDLMAIKRDKLIHKLNDCQRDIFNLIIHAVATKTQELIFVYGHGGIGKTFLWKTIIYALRGEGKIVLAVASSRIASLLLPSGRTAHLRFKIPLDLSDSSVCLVTKNTQLARLLKETCLIIWDESPMNDRRCFETLDRTLRDILDTPNKLFGENMCLTRGTLTKAEKTEVSTFAQWLLNVGDGVLGVPDESDPENTSWLEIPENFLIPNDEKGLTKLIEFIYDKDCLLHPNAKDLQDKAIVCLKIDTADVINAKVMDMLPGYATTYISNNEAIPHGHNGGEVELLYQVKYLNTLNFAGIPPHELNLKIGSPIMLLRNINIVGSLYNGTRMIVTQLLPKVIEVHIITGTRIYQKAYIPRIPLTMKDSKLPFVFKRKQFPVRLCYAMTINKSQVHVENMQRVVFRERDQLESVANNPHKKKTTLTEWDIRTVNHIVYPTYRTACEAMGLLGDGKEWEITLIEASATATPSELQTLLAHIFTHCIPNLYIDPSELENYTKYEFKACLNHCSRSLADFSIPLPPEDLMLVLTNRLLMEEKSYNRDLLAIKRDKLIGKTFLWKTIIYAIRAEGKIVLAAASSGIASLLLPSGRTAHSRFKLPLDLNDYSRDDTDDDELEDLELEAHYMYMAQLQVVFLDAADFGPIFDAELLQKVSNADHYNVFAIESEHPEQSEFVHDTYPID